MQRSQSEGNKVECEVLVRYITGRRRRGSIKWMRWKVHEFESSSRDKRRHPTSLRTRIKDQLEAANRQKKSGKNKWKWTHCVGKMKEVSRRVGGGEACCFPLQEVPALRSPCEKLGGGCARDSGLRPNQPRQRGVSTCRSQRERRIEARRQENSPGSQMTSTEQWESLRWVHSTSLHLWLSSFFISAVGAETFVVRIESADEEKQEKEQQKSQWLGTKRKLSLTSTYSWLFLWNKLFLITITSSSIWSSESDKPIFQWLRHAEAYLWELDPAMRT